jgi:hypothetical protein
MLTDQHWRHIEGGYRVPCGLTVTVCNERQSAKQASRTARRPGSFVMVGATMSQEGVVEKGTIPPPLTRADA